MHYADVSVVALFVLCDVCRTFVEVCFKNESRYPPHEIISCTKLYTLILQQLYPTIIIRRLKVTLLCVEIDTGPFISSVSLIFHNSKNKKVCKYIYFPSLRNCNCCLGKTEFHVF